MENAILIGVTDRLTTASLLDEHMDELERLVQTAGGRSLGRLIQERRAPDPAFWVGKGKCEELEALVCDLQIDLVVVEGELSPIQMRNLQDRTKARVLDRSDLILDIFARHARSREARLAVELALLEQQLPRLAGQWFGLSRQGGGIGSRGLGEKRLELDRRVVRTRIARLKKDLAGIETARRVRADRRRDASVVALCGYTNAGKSSLFQALTEDEGGVADRLFATLDAHHARLELPFGPPAVLVDTVGFIRKLPHRLVASFRATLAEVFDADLVLHVVDQAHPGVDEQMAVVRDTLADLDVEEHRVLLVRNKVDLIQIAPPGGLSVSAVSGEGLVDLKLEIATNLTADWPLLLLEVPAGDGWTLAALRASAKVLDEDVTADQYRFRARVPVQLLGRLRERGVVVDELTGTTPSR